MSTINNSVLSADKTSNPLRGVDAATAQQQLFAMREAAMANDNNNNNNNLEVLEQQQRQSTDEQNPHEGGEDPAALSWALTLTSRIPFDEDGKMTSIGSIFHHQGGCRPCRFHHHPGKPEGCQYGVGCLFCHFHHDRRRRRAVNDNRVTSNVNVSKMPGAQRIAGVSNSCGSACDGRGDAVGSSNGAVPSGNNHKDLMRTPSYPSTPPPPPSTPTPYSPPHIRRMHNAQSPPPTPFNSAPYRSTPPPPHHRTAPPSRGPSGPIPPPPSSPQSANTFLPSATNSTQITIPSPPGVSAHTFNRAADDSHSRFFAPIEPAAIDNIRLNSNATYSPHTTRAQQLQAAFCQAPISPVQHNPSKLLASSAAIPDWYHVPLSLDRQSTDSPSEHCSLNNNNNNRQPHLSTADVGDMLPSSNASSAPSCISASTPRLHSPTTLEACPTPRPQLTNTSGCTVNFPPSPPPGMLASIGSNSSALSSIDSMLFHNTTPNMSANHKATPTLGAVVVGQETPSTCYTSGSKSNYDETTMGGFTPSPTGSNVTLTGDFYNSLPPVSLPPLSTEVAEALLKTGAAGGDAELLRAILAPLFNGTSGGCDDNGNGVSANFRDIGCGAASYCNTPTPQQPTTLQYSDCGTPTTMGRRNSGMSTGATTSTPVGGLYEHDHRMGASRLQL